MITTKIQHHKLELEHYTGSLDFDCDFCGRNAYNNFHIQRDDEVVIVFCQECLDKAKLDNTKQVEELKTKLQEKTA